MGKRLTFTCKPKTPRAAKVAWAHIENKHGAPKSLWLDYEKWEWVAVFENKEIRVPVEEVS
jgi:hypothetical protein